LNEKANDLMKLNKHQEAIQYFDKAIDLFPNDSDAYSHKGNALWKLKQYDAANHCLEKAIELETDRDRKSFLKFKLNLKKNLK